MGGPLPWLLGFVVVISRLVRDLCSSFGFSWPGFVLLGLCILPAVLHGIEASLLASGSLRKLRSSVSQGLIWSRRQLLASVVAVPQPAWMGPLGVTLHLCVIWFRF